MGLTSWYNFIKDGVSHDVAQIVSFSQNKMLIKGSYVLIQTQALLFVDTKSLAHVVSKHIAVKDLFYSRGATVMILSFRKDRSGQTV